MEKQNRNSRISDICKDDVHRASMRKHLISKKHFETSRQDEMIIPDWTFEEPVQKKTKT